MKQKKPSLKVIAVEPFDSSVLSGPYKIQGIGAGFVPGIFNRNIVDEIYKQLLQSCRIRANVTYQPNCSRKVKQKPNAEKYLKQLL